MTTIIILALMLSLAMTGAWLLRMRGASSGWIDTIWSASVGTAGLAAIMTSGQGDAGRHLLLAFLLAGWSLRLAGHIAERTVSSSDDPRYAALAKEWGEDFPQRLFGFLQLQALAGLVLVMAIVLAAANPAPFPGLFDAVGSVVVLVAIAGESLADAQLRRFRRARRAGQAVCETGLWNWSRHPNYFFEWLGWCGFALLAIDPTGGYPLGALAFAAPLLMYHLLVHVSGIPPLEAHMRASRGNAYLAYQSRVSAFFPRPPRAAVDTGVRKVGK